MHILTISNIHLIWCLLHELPMPVKSIVLVRSHQRVCCLHGRVRFSVTTVCQICHCLPFLPLSVRFTIFFRSYHCLSDLPIIFHSYHCLSDLPMFFHSHHCLSDLPLYFNVTNVCQCYQCLPVMPLIIFQYFHSLSMLPLSVSITTDYLSILPLSTKDNTVCQ